VARLRRHGVRVGLFLQFGYPGEGWAEIQATRQLLRDVDPDEIGISVSYPLPGTRFYERVRAQLGAKRNWTESNDLDPLFPGAYSRDFYRTLAEVVHSEFRVSRGVRAARALIADPLGASAASLRTVTDIRHAGRWLVGRVRLEKTRRLRATPDVRS
jgi:anaerobic magnesium-protoporphyrin IX monomethyl ester cyclase